VRHICFMRNILALLSSHWLILFVTIRLSPLRYSALDRAYRLVRSIEGRVAQRW